MPDRPPPSLALALLLFAGGPLPAAGAQEPEERDEAPFRRHVLHLETGGVVRRPARERAGVWEVRLDDRVVALPADAVARASLERDLLARARALAGEVRRDDDDRRVFYAGWLAAEGLHAEALDELDRVLRRAPDHGPALALLAREELAVPLPELPAPEAAAAPGALEPFLREAAGLRPSVRELAIRRLGALRDGVDLRAALAAELEAPSVRRRALAAVALRRLFPGAEVRGLLVRAVLDGSEDVRREASLALAAADEPAVVVPVARALGSSSSAVRANAAEALGTMGYPHGVEPLIGHLRAMSAAQSAGGSYSAPASHVFFGRQAAYVQDFDVEVAQNSAIADPVIHTLTEGSVLDVRVLAVSASQVATERARARRALAALTGADPGGTSAAWLGWWDEHGAAWRAALPASAPATPAPGEGATESAADDDRARTSSAHEIPERPPLHDGRSG